MGTLTTMATVTTPELFFRSSDRDGPLVIDSNFGLLLEAREASRPQIRVMSDCCGLALHPMKQAQFSDSICVRCNAIYKIDRRFVDCGEKSIGHMLQGVLPVTRLDPLVETLAFWPLTDRISKAIKVWQQYDAKSLRHELDKHSGPLFPFP